MHVPLKELGPIKGDFAMERSFAIPSQQQRDIPTAFLRRGIAEMAHKDNQSTKIAPKIYPKPNF